MSVIADGFVQEIGKILNGVPGSGVRVVLTDQDICLDREGFRGRKGYTLIIDGLLLYISDPGEGSGT